MSLTITLPATKIVLTEQKLKLNIKQQAFCKLYASIDEECYGNATKCYMVAYGQKNYQTATAQAKMLMDKPDITAYINALISAEGFNDQNVDKQHLFIINQHKDLGTKMKGIEHYNRLKKRIADRMEIIIPKPIMELEENETIHMIDKKHAIDVSNENT